MTNSGLALALSSGGARGAYQAGAMRFFAEQGIRFSRVAGTSIGALNGAFYVQGDGSPRHMEELTEFWLMLSNANILQVSEDAVMAALKLFSSPDMRTLSAIAGRLALGGFSILDPGPIGQIMDAALDFARICSSPVPLIVATLPQIAPLFDIITGKWRKVLYHTAQELGPEAFRQVVLASVAVPLAYPSQLVGDMRYADAGLADPLPSAELRQDDIQLIFSIFTADTVLQNRADFPDQGVFQVRPSTQMNAGVFSLFDFSRQTIDSLLNLGYRDAQSDFSEAAYIAQQISKNRNTLSGIEDKAGSLPRRTGLYNLRIRET